MSRKFLYFVMIVLMVGCNATVDKNKEEVPPYDYNVEDKIKNLGIELNGPELPGGLSIVAFTRVGNLIYLSGAGPSLSTGGSITGKVGVDLSTEEGTAAARLTAINHLSTLKRELGDLNKVVKVVKVFGMVNAEPSFTDHPKVINGYSDLLVEIFGERGRHARSAVGMGSLPYNIACEIEAIVEVKD